MPLGALLGLFSTTKRKLTCFLNLQAWIESSSSGAILLFTAAELESISVRHFGLSPASAGLIGGCGGGIAQAYLSMGICTTMKVSKRYLISLPYFAFIPYHALSSCLSAAHSDKTAEITRAKMPAGTARQGTLSLFLDILRKVRYPALLFESLLLSKYRTPKSVSSGSRRKESVA